jgi:23S rRNA pseudouridine1911/1915/1917 synthase
VPALPRILTADRGDAGRRIDLVVRRHMTDLHAATRTRVQAWIERGHVSINGHVVRRVSTRATLGDQVAVQVPEEDAPNPVLAEDIPLDVIFEDDYLLVVNKPAGLVSHPTYGHPTGSLLNTLLFHAQHWNVGQRPSLVGRLDKLTSGVVLIAKSTPAHARLQRVLGSALSEKVYLAVVYGPVAQSHGEIALHLSRDPDDRRRVIATRNDGTPSMTRYVRLDQTDIAGPAPALLQCRLMTGRMHQIRVHLASSGWPIVGDPKYGEPRWQQIGDVAMADALGQFPRQALHAWRMSFVHPFTNERLEVEAPIADDVSALLRSCGLQTPTAAVKSD